MSNNIELSIVAPLYNEEESVGHLFSAITNAIEPMDVPYEILFVNDGSKDATLERAIELAKSDSRLRVVNFRKNYGQTPAMAAGIDHAVGKIIVTMDGDLQNDPTDIPMMVSKLKEGYHIVVGWRHNRQDKLITRKIPSMIANRLIGKVTGVPIKDNGCSLKVYRAEVMQSLPFYNELHRFIPALLSVSGAQVAEVKVKHHARQFGESKYGLSRVYKVLLDLLTIKTILSVANHPIRWFTSLAIPNLLLSLIFTISLLANTGNSSIVIETTLSLLFFSTAVFLFCLGFLSELVFRKGNISIDQLALLTAHSNGKKYRVEKVSRG